MEYIFLDLDGTLTDSSEGIINSITEALERMGVPVNDRNALRRYIGPPLSVTFSEYFEGERVTEAILLYRKRYSELGWKENRPYDGIHNALAKLQTAGKKLVMATSKPEVYAKQIADFFGLSGYFTAICGASFDQKVNSKEEVIRYALKSLGITDVSQVVMVGDRFHDVEGAAALGIPTLGVTYGFGTEEELLFAGAYAVAHSPEEMCELLLTQK